MKLPIALRPAARVSLALLGACLAAPALAQSSTPAQSLLDNRFVFNLGAFLVQTDAKARLDGSSPDHPDVDFDKTFGTGKDATRIRADALWRFSPNHHLRYMYFNNTSSRSEVLKEDITWGDYTFETGSNIRADMKYSIQELAYEYAFMRRPDYELAASLGVHYTDISLKLSGAAKIDGEDIPFASQEASAPVPLPVFGLRAGWAVAPQWYLDAQAQFFKPKVGDYDGSLSDLRVGATWMYNPNFGIGLGYDRFFTNLDINREAYQGRLRFGYSGLRMYLTGTF